MLHILSLFMWKGSYDVGRMLACIINVTSNLFFCPGTKCFTIASFFCPGIKCSHRASELSPSSPYLQPNHWGTYNLSHRAASGCEPLSFNIWWTLALAMSLPHTNLGFPLQPSKSPAMLFYTRLGNKLVWKKRVLKHFDSETNASVGCLALNKNDGGSGIMGRLWWQR